MEELQKYIDKIDYMLFNHKFEWANNTLGSMANYADKNNNLTEKQMKAIDNIYNSVSVKLM